jgi:tetratricopeptide (TPR) repeat protein
MLRLPSRRLLSRRRILPTLLLSLLATTLFGNAETDQQPTVLSPAQPSYFHLLGSASLEINLDAQAGHEAEIFLETSARDVTLIALSPAGQQLEVVHAQQPGWLVLSFSCTQQGRYRLIVRRNAVENASRGTSLRADYLPFPAADASRRAEAATSFTTAQSLANSSHEASIRASIVKYRKAAAVWASLGDREGQVISLAAEAQAWLNLSQYGNALSALNRARFLGFHKIFFRAWLASLEADVYLDKWDSELAMRSAQEAERLSRELSDQWLTADALVDRGGAEYLIGDSADQSDIEEALKLSRAIDADGIIARALRCKSWMEGDQGHVTRAMAFMSEAEEEFRAAGQVRNAVDAMANLATIQGMDGSRYPALIRHSSLVPLVRESGNLADFAFLLLNIANDYLELNRAPDAIAYYKEAVEIFRKIGFLSGESISMSQLCMAETRADRLSEAIRDCSESAAIAKQLHDRKRVAITIWRLGKVQEALGNSEQAIASFRKAYEISASVEDPHAEAQSLMDWGDALELQEHRDQAREKFEEALPLSRKAEDVPEELEARFRIARSEFEASQYEDAKSDLNVALKSVDAQRRAVGNPDLQASTFAQLRKCHELYIELLMREHERDPSSSAAAQALEVSESGRALSLLDVLSIRRRSSSPPQPSKPRELTEMQTAVDHAYDQRLRLILRGANRRELEVNEAALTEVIDTLERAEDARKATPSAYEMPSGTPLKVGEIVAASRSSHTTLVEYALGADHSYVWVVYDGKIESHVLPGRKIIESAVKEWRTLATARATRSGAVFKDSRNRVAAADFELPRVGARLSCMLLAHFLQPSMDRLAIVPDGDLELLPFAALPENGCEGGVQPLAETRQTYVAPSLTILLLPSQAPERDSFRGEIALLADPVFDARDPRVHRTASSNGNNEPEGFGVALPRLYGTRDEARSVAALVGPDRSVLYLDFDANLRTLLDPSLSKYRMLHLATHGLFDESAPGLSGIVLSLVNPEGQPVFGYLKNHDVENLNLRFDLVVLSSCDSGAGRNLNGEGMTGLNHAFLSAGATRVLYTLWSVDDDTSKELMVAFYGAIFRDGLDPAEALRRSQMKLLHNPATRAPYFWAGFTITSTAL